MGGFGGNDSALRSEPVPAAPGLRRVLIPEALPFVFAEQQLLATGPRAHEVEGGIDAPIRKFALQLLVEPVHGHGPSGKTTVTAFLRPSAQLAEVWSLGGGDAYGYGLFVGTSPRGGRMIEHGGDTELGFNAGFYQYPDSDAVLIVISNGRDANGLSSRQSIQEYLERMLFGDTVSRPLPPRVVRLSPSRMASLAARPSAASSRRTIGVTSLSVISVFKCNASCSLRISTGPLHCRFGYGGGAVVKRMSPVASV